MAWHRIDENDRQSPDYLLNKRQLPAVEKISIEQGRI